jgi:CBS domain-containing protein
MKLKDVMTRDVEIISPDATIQEAAAKMKALDIGPLPVGEGGHLLGMVTDRDLTIRATAEGLDPTTPVRTVMTPNVIACFEDDDVREAAEIMQREQIRRLLVVDRNKQVVGIVSIGDLAVDTGEDKLMGQTLEQISEPAEPDR